MKNKSLTQEEKSKINKRRKIRTIYAFGSGIP